VTERPATIDDALYFLDAHRKSGCWFRAMDYAHQTKGFDFDRMKRGAEYIASGLQAADKKRSQT
jgi:hypothetical protein